MGKNFDVDDLPSTLTASDRLQRFEAHGAGAVAP
jgi:hypothetical protein